MPEPEAATGTRVDPYRAYNFQIEIQGQVEGHFTEVKGLGIKVEVIPYREGGAAQSEHKLPGRVSYADVELRYGLTTSRVMWDWFMTGVRGTVERKHCAIRALDNDGVTEVMRWNLTDCWISEWRGTPLDALSQTYAVESVVLVCENLERA